MKADNAVIMAAGTASRFAPLSYEKPKALVEVKGEVMIERQIRQLKSAGINEIIIVTGYLSEQFEYLKSKFGVKLIYNPYYLSRNNNSSIYAARNYLKNSYICSSDNYFTENPFDCEPEGSFYSAVYAKGETDEWCITENDGSIEAVTIGGSDSWIMLGPVFWSEDFSRRFLEILEPEFENPETYDKFWETIYIEHINSLPMRIKKFSADFIFEFDTLDELRKFDPSYVTDTRSAILKTLAKELSICESDIRNVKAFKDRNNAAAGFTFTAGKRYRYYYATRKLEEELC